MIKIMLCFKSCVAMTVIIASVGEDGLNIPRIIMNQLKWLDRIIDGAVCYFTI